MSHHALYRVRLDIAHDREALFNEVYEVEDPALPMSKLWNDTSDIGRSKPEVWPYPSNKRYIVSERILTR